MACLRKIPSPWQEAAKGVFHVKGLECQYGAQAESDMENAIADWAGDSSIPVVAYRNEKLRTGWVEILMLAERPPPSPPSTTSPSTPHSTAFIAAPRLGTTWNTVSPADLSCSVYRSGLPAEVVTNFTP